MFKNQLFAFIRMIKEGERPLEFEETERIIKVLLAGKMSRERGREISMEELG